MRQPNPRKDAAAGPRQIARNIQLERRGQFINDVNNKMKASATKPARKIALLMDLNVLRKRRTSLIRRLKS